MRALIVGGSGAIGSAVARHACDLGVETHVAVRASSRPDRLATHAAITRHAVELANPEAMAALLRRMRPDWIAMAAFPSGHATDRAHRHRLLLGMGANLLGLLEAMRLADVGARLTWIGSAMAYAMPGNDASAGPSTFRGAVKAAESLLAARLAADFGIAATELRVFTGYGPFEQRERPAPRPPRAALDGQRVPLAATPARRDWVHYEDIARACLASAAATPSRVFDVCSGRKHDTREVARALEQIVGRPLIAEDAYPEPERYGEVVTGTVPRASEGLDWAPRIDLAQGLERSWEWAQSATGRQWLGHDAMACA